MMGVLVDEDNVAIESSDESQIVVIDSEGCVLFKNEIKEAQGLFAFSSELRKVFVVENKERILQWDVEKKVEPKVVFDITQLVGS